MWATCPRSASSGYHAEFHEGCYQKHTNPLNCRTSSSDISGCHAEFHEGHGTVGEWQGMCELTRHGMAGERHGRGTAWVRHGMCELPRHGMCELPRHGMAWELHERGMACVN
jgi:hypothetical protein